MEKEYVALEGKVFVVELLSKMGSTNYGWCISRLPEQIIVMGTENISMGGLCGVSTLQRFYFGAVSAEKIDIDILFTLNSWSNLADVADKFTAKVRIIPSDSEEFVSYSENVVNTAIPYGLVYTDCSTQNPRAFYRLPYDNPDITMKYGYPCGVQEAALKYGYPCGVQDVSLKYGYPCGAQEAALKYGYPCGVQDVSLKYGYPCEMQNTALKYGYPCGAQEAALKYSYPCGAQDVSLKYGYPCEMQDTALKYGYPCGAQEAALKYGYPCGAQEAALKYGYPCGVQDANMKYGYICLDYTKEARPYGYPY